MTLKNDFKEKMIDIVEAGKGGGNDRRLRLLANTLATNDETVKFLGIRSVREVDFVEPKAVSFDIDWNSQANGSYLAAGAYLCPTCTDVSPGDEPDWIKIEYVGVPPGRNARLQVVTRTGGNQRMLFDEGWPDRQRKGRKIDEVTVSLRIDNAALKLYENGVELFSTTDHGLSFTKGYLYLEMSSHSNYPARTVFFDNVSVRAPVERLR